MLIIDDDNGYGTPFGDKFYKVTYLIVDNGEPGTIKISFPSNIEYDIEEIHQKVHEMIPNALITEICTL